MANDGNHHQESPLMAHFDSEVKDDSNASSSSRDLENQDVSSIKSKNCLNLKKSLLSLIILSVIGAVALLAFCTSQSISLLPEKHLPALSLEELRNGTYNQRIQGIQWLPNGKNGEFIKRTEGGFAISHWENQDATKVVAPASFRDAQGKLHSIVDLSLNRAQTHAIATTNVLKHWRHSTFSKAWIYDLQAETFTQLHESRVSIASFSPDGHRIAFVLNNNIFMYDLKTGDTQQITFDGGADVFNGIPDWVYEEEVFAGDSAMWWSPQSKHLIFMKSNDSLVPKFPIPYFLTSAHNSDTVGTGAAYPDLVEIKYPKPGYPNPKAELWAFSVRDSATSPVEIPTQMDEPIISEVIWVGEQAVVKLISRESDEQEVWVWNAETRSIKRSRAYSSKDLEGAWFEVTHNSRAFKDEGYIDTIDVNGYNHLGFFSPADSADPIVLTRGDWEVQDSSMAIDVQTREVYFHATRGGSMVISLYKTRLDSPGSKPELVAYQGEGVYTADFSADATFANIIYTSPHSPLVQKVVKLSNSSHDGHYEHHDDNEWVVESNESLRKLLIGRNIVNQEQERYGSVVVAPGVSVNYREILPSKFDATKKHKLLFFNYGGPGSQQVQRKFTLDFQRVFAETHNAVVVTVDPRGTGNRGRKFKASVRDHLGEYEADDVIAVAKLWNQFKYVDSRSTAIWGWSYGGFLTLKTLERDTDLAFKYGVAVAPVTDWSLYDSIYTERYMHKPENNEQGYRQSKINNVENIGRHNRFLVMHGTGDDNVHFQNTLRFLDKLDLSNVENYDVHIFPDSDHSIYFHNANKIVYDKIDQWLRKYQQEAT